MSKKTDIIKRQSPEIWKWAGTTNTSLGCHETEIDESIETMKHKIENAGLELLDVHVFRWDTGEIGLGMVNIQFLIRKGETNSGYVL
ncbi:hypothetical protein [Heyndrickxia ginsengihumi]|uniref:hypothetical protein n=1 Tax=Heyndrickxia ginsengihumi TaxID=363870 RepID=UPI003D1F6129